MSEEDVLLSVRADPDHPNHSFCVKGAAAPRFVHDPTRLRHPMRRTNPKTAADPGWERIGWDEALTFVARRMREIAAAHGPESVVFTRPAPGGSHAGDWSPFLDRLAAAFGTPNVMTTGHICSWGRSGGAAHTFGGGLPTAHYEDAATILVWGHNPAVSNVQTWRRIQRATRRGARLVVVDPRATGTTRRADLWLRPRPGTDAALALGVTHLLLARGYYDPEFVTWWTNGPFLVDTETGRLLRRDGRFVVSDGSDEHAVDVEADPSTWGVRPRLRVDRPGARSAFSLLAERAARYDPETVARLTGVSEVDLGRLADLLANGPVCYDTYNGVEQHTDTAQTSRALGVLYALTGWLESPGGNVTFSSPGGLPKLRTDSSRRLGLADRPLGAPRNGVAAYDVYDAALTGHPYPVHALVAFGGNALLQNGDTRRGAEALRSLDLHVHVDMRENPTARFADLLLPASTPWESPGLVTGFGGGPDTQTWAQYRAPVVPPQHESRPDVEILFDLAVRLGLGDQFWDGDVHAAYAAQLEGTGLTLDELRASPGGLRRPGRTLTYHRHTRVRGDGTVTGFATPTRKVELYSEAFLDAGHDPLPVHNDRSAAFTPEFPLTLTSAKLRQYTHSTGRSIPSLRTQAPEPFLEVHPDDADTYGVHDGAMVRLATASGAIRLRAKVSTSVAAGVVATQTGWWEACEELGLPGHDPFSADGANVNLIISNAVRDPISGSVPVKDYPCRIEPLP
ncbi:molybdopterin-containing oxidoreductase family protein [Actinophytocola oryzae]|uniref:molybdopterin-containing oxidoreductase family protein n=1 Tax=Actinophytocola oryzae TaxID=502181 RepID=UPI001FB8F57A